MANFIVQGGDRLPASGQNALIFIDNGNGSFTMTVAPAPSTYPTNPSLITPGSPIIGGGMRGGNITASGTGVLNGITEVTIVAPLVTASSRIFLSIQVPGGTPLGVIYVSSRIPGVSFGVKGAATDTSIFAWMILEP